MDKQSRKKDARSFASVFRAVNASAIMSERHQRGVASTRQTTCGAQTMDRSGSTDSAEGSTRLRKQERFDRRAARSNGRCVWFVAWWRPRGG